ncbi:hypothetical protein [Oceanobacillus saliphilus]|uniref:hypothetical protein n=1 Tax=Oceanobacillus saliphilus TaxID=2925834 RepID=UPI00201DBB69|nr:hypothetical protein [Oceanobacillus saliphilus]
MRRLFLLGALLFILVIAGCSNLESDSETDSQNEGKDMNSQEDTAVVGEVDDLNLQVQKSDEEAGITIEDSPIYRALAEAIDVDPKMGIPNDFSLYPYDIALNEDGSSSIIFLAINRLEDSIKDVSFNLTFGHQNGDYIFKDMEIVLPEEQIGVIEADSSVPFLIDITPEDEAIFETLDMNNVYMELANFKMDAVE